MNPEIAHAFQVSCDGVVLELRLKTQQFHSRQETEENLRRLEECAGNYLRNEVSDEPYRPKYQPVAELEGRHETGPVNGVWFNFTVKATSYNPHVGLSELAWVSAIVVAKLTSSALKALPHFPATHT